MRLSEKEILGVRVNSIDQPGLLSTFQEWAKTPSQKTITYVNAHCLNLAKQDREYLELLNRFDLVYSDGVGVVWAGKFLSGQRFYKVTGRAVIREFCEMCQREGISLYLLGGKPGVADEARKRMLEWSPKLLVLGVCDGYFQEKSETEVLASLAELKPDVVLVGMGAPLQEKWIFAHLEQTHSKVCWAIGALIDYIAGIEPPVPSWMEKLALEWLWRLLVNPKDKWKRYIVGNPKFVIRVLIKKYF